MKDSQLDQYIGKWRIYDDAEWYDGVLNVDHDKRSIVLNITIPCDDKNPVPRLPYIGHVPFVNGRFQNGAIAVLYDCKITLGEIHGNQCTEQSVIPEYCFIGLTTETVDDIRFTKAEFDFGEIIAWSNLCNYRWDWTESIDPIIRWKKQEKISFKLREGVEIVFSPQIGRYFFFSTTVKSTIEQHVYVELQYQTPQEWSVIMDDALSIRYFIGLGMNRYIGIEQAYYYHPKHVERIPIDDGVFERPYSMDVWFGDEDLVHTTEGIIQDYTFLLSDCKETGILERWSAIYPKLKPVLDLYFSAAKNNVRVPEIVFLNLMQALETYHARFIADTKDDYIRHVDQMLKEVFMGDNSEVEKEWRARLISSDQESPRCNKVYLKSRLADLVFAEGIIRGWSFNEGKGEDFVTKLVYTRNYYTHYSEDKKDKAYTKDELPFVVRHLLCLLKYHLLTQMGLDKIKTWGKIVDERSRINVGYGVFSQTLKMPDRFDETETDPEE